MSWSLPESAQRIPLSHRSPSPTNSEVQLGENRGHSLAHSVPRQAPSLWPGSEPLVHSFTGKTAGRRAHALIISPPIHRELLLLAYSKSSTRCFGCFRSRHGEDPSSAFCGSVFPLVKTVIRPTFLTRWENSCTRVIRKSILASLRLEHVQLVLFCMCRKYKFVTGNIRTLITILRKR